MNSIKKLLALCFFAFAFGALNAQSNLTLYGTVVDYATTNPIANQAVHVVDSSSNNPVPFHTVYTNSMGWFTDTLVLFGNGDIHILTADCLGNWQDTSFSYTGNSPSYWSVTKNFQICTSSATNCNYTTTAQPNLVNTSVQFSTSHQSNPANPSTYSWTFGDGNTGSGPNPTHTYNAPGTYIYCLQVDSCPPVCDTVVVAASSPCSAAFNIADSALTAFVTPAAAGQSGYFIFSWGDGQADTMQANALPFIPWNHTYASAGTYQVCVEYFDAWVNPNCYDMVCDSVSVQPANPNPLQCNAQYIVDTVNSVQGTVVLWNSTTVNGITPSTNLFFDWSFGDGNYSNLPYPSHQYNAPGLYEVCLTVYAMNANGDSCSSTFCDSLGMDQNGNLIYKGVATGFQLNVLDPNSFGIDEGALQNVSTYPNPVTNVLTINVPENLSGNASFTLYNVNGQKVRQLNASGSNLSKTMNIEDLADGLYILDVNINSQTKKIKVLKQ